MIDPPLLLDLYCCAGGAARGYHDAGFEVVGVDKADQPNYPYFFLKMDALEAMNRLLGGEALRFFNRHGMMRKVTLEDVTFVHSSPPCQRFTAYRRKGHGVGDNYLNLIPETRELLNFMSNRHGIPWVIENVEGAWDQLVDAVKLCGSSFGLDVRRHRLFEFSEPLPAQTPACDHSWQKPRFAQATNRKNLRSTVEVGVWRIPLEVQEEAMGIPHGAMTLRELSESIPPAYTQWIGSQLIGSLALATSDSSSTGGEL